jgi:hypothetical protein
MCIDALHSRKYCTFWSITSRTFCCGGRLSD